jgi:hypothetical protein
MALSPADCSAEVSENHRKDEELTAAEAPSTVGRVPQEPLCRQRFGSDDVSSPFILLLGLGVLHWGIASSRVSRRGRRRNVMEIFRVRFSGASG